MTHLDLTSNNLVSLPAGLLCPLPKLKILDLSLNNIGDLERLGLSDRTESQCRVTSLEELVIRGNGLRSAPPGSLAALERLKSLDLSRNELGVLVDTTFR